MFYSSFSRKPVAYNGRLAADPDGARVEFFDAGTNTVRTMYSNGALTVELDPLDIRTDANGCFPAIYGQGGPYKAKVYAPGGAVLYTEDNIPGDVTASGGGGGGGSTTQITGDIQPSVLSGSRAGFVRANGNTIGSATSGATELADPTAQALFLALWPNTLFSVSGGRGASAAADWAANKTIALPDGKLCALIGVDGMGGSSTNLFSALTFLTGNAATVGSKVGAANVALTANQNGPHTHTGSTSSDGVHQHTGTTGGAGGHSHTGSTTFDGNHQHTASVNATGSTLFVGAGGGNVPQAGATLIITSTDGSHNHSIATTFDGFHSHAFTSDAAGAHAHTFTTASSGTGADHANVQPSLLVTFYIKL